MNKKKPNKRVIDIIDMSEKKPNKRILSKANKNARNKRYILEKDEGLKEKAKVLNDSIEWWEQRMNDAFDKLDRLEEKENSFGLNFNLDEELQKIVDELLLLSKRGEIEKKNSRIFEKEVDIFLKECQDLI